MMTKRTWIAAIFSSLALAACGTPASSGGNAGADASVDTGPIGITETGIAAPTQFACTSASKNAAGFSWQGSPTSGVIGYVVERAPLAGEFVAQPAVDAKTLTFADLTVAQGETYRYRVRAKVGDKLGDSSNEVSVGAPPPGLHTAADTAGTHVDFALDRNGDPAVLYHDGTALQFVGWDRTRADWKAPTKVTSDLALGTPASNAAALAFDSAGSSGTFAAIWASADGQEIDWALSSDGGKTWQADTIAVSPAGTSYSQPTVVLGNGKAHVAWLQDGAKLFYATGTLSTPPKNWTADKEAPVAVKADKLLPFVPSIALDAAQQPAIGYFSHGTDESVIATFWRPGDKNATVIASSGGYADAQASLSLAFKGQAPRAAVTLRKSATTAAAVWFVTSSDGNSWGTPLALPVDGAAFGGTTTRLVTSKSDASAITTDSSGQGGGKCGEPKLATSADGVTWSTCSPNATPTPGESAQFSRIALDANQKRWLAWLDVAGKRVRVWREP